MGIFTVLTTFEISGSVMYRGLAKFEGEKRAEYLSSALGAISALNIGSLALYIIFRNFLNDITSLDTHLTIVLFLQVFLNAALGVYFAEKRYSGEYRTVALINIGMGTLSPLLALFFIYLGGGGEARIIAPLISSALFTLPVIYSIIKKGRRIFSREVFSFLFKITLPMLPHYLSLSLIAQFDKIIIARNFGDGAVGRYSAAYSVGFLLSLLSSGILLVLAPRAMQKQKENKNDEVSAALSASGRLIAYATLAFLTLAPETFYLVVSHEYYDAMPVIYPIAISVFFLFMSSAASNCLIHYERPFLITKNSLITSAVCVFLCIFLIRRWGYIGGAYVTLFSYILLFALNSKTLKKISGGSLSISYTYNFWGLLLVYSLLAYIFRFSLFTRLLLLSALILLLLPEFKKYKKLAVRK